MLQSGFSPGTDVTDPTRLFGHKEKGQLLDQVFTHLILGTNIQILGERRSGKTSLLRCVAAKIKASEYRCIPVYLNYREYPTVKGSAAAYRLLLATIHAAVMRHPDQSLPKEAEVLGVRLSGGTTAEVHLEVLNSVQDFMVPRLLEQYISWIGDLEAGIILMLDEYEHLLRRTFEGQEGAFFVLRDIASRPEPARGRSKLLTYAIAGSKPWDQLCQMVGSPELNNIGATLHVGPLDPGAFGDMWAQCLQDSSEEARSKVAESSASLDTVYGLTGGWPFYGKVIGNYMIAGQGSEDSFYSQLTPHFNVIWANLSEAEKRLMLDVQKGAARIGALGSLARRGLVVDTPELRPRGRLWSTFVDEQVESAQDSPEQAGHNRSGLGQTDLHLLVQDVITLVTEINEASQLLSREDIFKCSNQDVPIYRDLETPALGPEQFTHFALSMYNLLFERTRKRGRNGRETPLESLPNRFRKVRVEVRIVDSVRHHFGKGHLTRVPSFQPSMPIAEICNRYLHQKVPPVGEQYLTFQLGMLKDLSAYLQDVLRSF